MFQNQAANAEVGMVYEFMGEMRREVSRIASVTDSLEKSVVQLQEHVLQLTEQMHALETEWALWSSEPEDGPEHYAIGGTTPRSQVDPATDDEGYLDWFQAEESRALGFGVRALGDLQAPVEQTPQSQLAMNSAFQPIALQQRG